MTDAMLPGSGPLSFLDVAHPHPPQAQTARLLLRALKTKDPHEALPRLLEAKALDLSQDPWSSGGPAMSLGFLEAVPALTSLKLDHQKLDPSETLAGLWRFPLRSLSLKGFAGNIDVAAMAAALKEQGRIPVLEELDLSACSLEHPEALADLVALRVLALAKTKLTDVSFLLPLVRLESLDLSENSISRLPPLGGCTGLRVLKMNKNAVEDLVPLAPLRKLKTLDVSENAVSDLAPLEGMRDLSTLRFARNRVRTVRPLRHLDMLETVALALNPLAEDEIDDILRRRVRIE